MKLFVKLFCIVGMIAAMISCSSSKNIGDKSLLSGEWITITPQNSPNVTIESSSKLFLLMNTDEATTDTLRFSYRLKGKKLTLFMDDKMVSVSELKKLTNDSLVYKRERDNEVFSYKRKAK